MAHTLCSGQAVTRAWNNQSTTNHTEHPSVRAHKGDDHQEHTTQHLFSITAHQRPSAFLTNGTKHNWTQFIPVPEYSQLFLTESPAEIHQVFSNIYRMPGRHYTFRMYLGENIISIKRKP